MHNKIAQVWEKMRGVRGTDNTPRVNSREDSIKWIDGNAEPGAVDRQAEKEVRSAKAGHPVDEGGGGGGD